MSVASLTQSAPYLSFRGQQVFGLNKASKASVQVFKIHVVRVQAFFSEESLDSYIRERYTFIELKTYFREVTSIIIYFNFVKIYTMVFQL